MREPRRGTPNAIASRSWLIQLGGNSSTELWLGPDDSPSDQRRVVMVRQLDRYNFTNAGLEYQAHLSLDIHGSPLSSVFMSVDPQLTPISAKFGDQETPLSILRSGPSDTPMEIQLPAGFVGDSREIHITAFAPLVADTTWRLPHIRPKGAIWQQGRATLEIPSSLVLKRLVPKSALEATVEPSPAPLSGETRSLLLYEPGSSIEVMLSQAAENPQIITGTTLRLNPSLISARIVAQVTPSRGSLYVVESQVLNGWFVDRIESVPADALEPIAPWTLRGRRLRVRLRSGARPDHPVQVIIHAHRHVASLPLAGSEFRVLSFDHLRHERGLISLCPDSPYHLQVTRNADVPRLDTERMNPDERTMVELPEGSLAYEDSVSANEFIVSMNFEVPRYAASIACRAVFGAQQLRESYRIRVEPAGVPVARLLVHFSQSGTRRRGGVCWAMRGANCRRGAYRKQKTAARGDLGYRASLAQQRSHRNRSGAYE